MPTTFIIDALLPAEMAGKAEETGVRKANMSALTMFVLAVLAGAFITLGAIFFTITVIGDLPFGLKRLLSGIILLNNLAPVTIGNIIGGTIMVGAVYWFIYLRQASGDNSSQVAD